MKRDHLLQTINTASKSIGKTWPLYAFVTSNPLSGYESKHFQEATKKAEKLMGGQLLPKAEMLREAWENGDIEKKELQQLFNEYNIDYSIEDSLTEIEANTNTESKNPSHPLDTQMIKWLMSYMDEGLSEWSMPNKEKGFYKAWLSLAKYDQPLKSGASKLPKSSEEALTQILKEYTEEEQLNIFEYHLSALPGWAGYIKYRMESNSEWQQHYSINLEEYLAVRLSIAQIINSDILPKHQTSEEKKQARELSYIWLKAWEQSWQKKLSLELNDSLVHSEEKLKKDKTPDAQMVFCIDTRSELIRRHIESKGNYETFGYAGFFGIAMDYQAIGEDIIKKSCPPIVASSYKVTEQPKEHTSEQAKAYQKRQTRKKFTDHFLNRMKHMLPSAFGYVEGSGFFYGISLFLRTVIPGKLYNPEKKERQSYESSCHPSLESNELSQKSDQISLKEKVAIVKSGFNLMGWRTFSPLVLFVGHGSHSANNPFGSSLDCGACAASPGRHNARMLALLANLPEVRKALKEQDINIPDSTVFLGAEHNTTTDEIVIFDSELPSSHENELKELKKDLSKAQITATSERYDNDKNSVKTAHTKTNDWSEIRPEWGLAKNKGFVIGPRSLSQDMNLEGNCFLHSYDWKLDTEGKSLEGIMQGPMVVTQWINNHYYFSTVDNENYGGGSKISHNITGGFGVLQGNGSDLKMGLPLQSVNLTDQKNYHQPLRLSVFIQAPLDRVTTILERNESLKSLLDNEWIYLLVIDPTKDNQIKKYDSKLEWKDVNPENEVLSEA